MAKIPFNMSKNEQYIECHRPFKLPNGKYSGIIRVYELLNPTKVNMLTTMDWSFDPVIVDPDAITGYNSLQIDCQFVNLEKLVQDLCNSRLRVNKLGYCYFQIMRGVANTTETFGFAFYRLNDMLRWSNYGVSVKLDKPDDVGTLWDRFDILDGSKFDVKEIHQKDNNNDSVNDQRKAVIQELTDRVKELEVQIDMYVVNLPIKYYVPASPALFNIERLPNYVIVTQSILQKWKLKPDRFRPYTPTCVPVTKVKSHRAFLFELKQNEGFDTSNWYFVEVTERVTPILVYEGAMNTIRYEGHTMNSPVDGSALIEFDVQGWFNPIILVGVGPRICIRII